MRQRLGALLCLALGAVLIWSGLSAGGAGNVGISQSCGAQFGVMAPCPTGTIHFAETTTVHHATMTPDDATPPAGGWKVHITSTCNATSGGQPVDETVTVPNNGTADSDSLYVFSDTTSATMCDYTLSETNSGDFTATFDPASPVQLPDNTRGGNTLDEALANDITVRTTSPAPPSSSTPAPPSSSAPSNSASVSASSSSSLEPSVVPSSSGGGLANTGPSRSINGSLIGGVALCVLGLVLLFAGRVRRPRKHGA